MEPFLVPVDLEANPIYTDYIFHPNDLSTVEKKVGKWEYGSTDAFLADIKWIQHNCTIFNGQEHELSKISKVIVRQAEAECQVN